MKAAFIIGPSRSGTTVLAQALGRHARIVATDELHYYNLLKPLAEKNGHSRGWVWARLDAIERDERFFEIKSGTLTDLPEPDDAALPAPDVPLLRAFLEQLGEEADASATVEQTPMNLYYRDEIRRDFPGALFLLMQRDPRAIIASQKMRWKVGAHGRRNIPARDIARVRHAGHPLLQLLLLRKTLRAMAVAMTEADVVLVTYEDMVSRPESVLTDLAARFGLENDSSMLGVTDAGSSHAAESGRTGFDSARLEGWRKSLTATETWLVERFYGDALVLPKTGARPRLVEALRLALSLPPAVAMALYHSAGGYGNLIDAVRRRFL